MGDSHHRKYYERADGYKYTELELDAYHVPYIARNKCVNFYVPYQQCDRTNSFFGATLDKGRGNCTEEFNNYQDCMNKMSFYQTGAHVQNAFYENSSQAYKDGFSQTYAANFRKSPLEFQL